MELVRGNNLYLNIILWQQKNDDGHEKLKNPSNLKTTISSSSIPRQA
jgi:hypothetical protein